METFRIRQLYSDAATAYLDGYQNYPKRKKLQIIFKTGYYGSIRGKDHAVKWLQD